MPSLGGIDVVTQAGALKKQDWTLMNEFTGPAIEGPENDRPGQTFALKDIVLQCLSDFKVVQSARTY